MVVAALITVAQSPIPARADIVTTVRGDRITGKVVATDADGNLRLTGPDFGGEVVVLASALARIEFVCEGSPVAGDEVALTNGDRVVGRISAITPDTAIIESPAVGVLKISRRAVKSVAFACRVAGLLESAFHRGTLAPWTAQQGTWKVADGTLQCPSTSSTQTVFAKLDQTEALTAVAHVEATSGPYLQVCLVLFADATSGTSGRNSVFARFHKSRCYLMHAHNGSYRNIGNGNMRRTPKRGVLRLAYDPSSGQAKAWLDAKLVCQRAVPNLPKSGQFVMLSSRYACRIRYIQVLHGIVPPCGQPTTGESTSDIVRLANGDRIAATSVTVADGKAVLSTSFGDLNPALERVRSIAFRTGGLEVPRRNKGDVWVDTSDGRLTLQFQELTSDHLVGESACLGQVNVRRKSIKTIRFNIHK